MSEMELLNALYEDMQELKKRTEKQNEDIQELRKQTNIMDKRISGIQLSIENEINRNIQIIAESHLDLNRKLNSALEIEQSKELMAIRLNFLEGEVRKLKERIDQTA